MKNLLCLTLCVAIMMLACSKKHVTPTTGPITIAGKAYNTTVIGNQTWTTENYDGPGGTANSQEANIGKFYLLSEIQSIPLPSGWRIPTQADFIGLLKSQGLTTTYDYGSVISDSAGSQHMRAITEWGIAGDNKSGFNALPSGDYDTSMFEDTTQITRFWSSTPATNFGSTPYQWTLYLTGYVLTIAGQSSNMQGASVSQAQILNYGYNIRFVKDN
jgi:uncharacterized protein (TIGR02145 family)